MNETDKYWMRWRGKQSGPFTIAEINRQLDSHEIGMSHEIQYQDRWIRVEEFLELAKPGASASASAKASLASQARPGLEAKERPSAFKSPVNEPPVAAQISRPVKAIRPASYAGPHPKSRWVFACLAIFLGFLGIHNFYARHWLTGIIQLLLSAASCLLGFGVIVPWVWAMFEAVLVRQDGNELEMT